MSKTGTLQNGLIVVFCAIASLAALVIKSVALSALGVIVLLLSVALLARRQPILFAVLLPVLVLRVAEPIAVLSIEAGAYSEETGLRGVPGASTWLLATYTLLFLLAVSAGWKSRIEQVALVALNERKLAFLALAVASVVALIGTYAGVTDGFALMSGQNRYATRATGTSGVLELFLNNRYVALVLLGIVTSRRGLNRALRSMAIGGAAAILIIGLLHGEQATAAATSLGVFLAPVIAVSISSGRSLRLSLPLLALLGIASLGAAGLVYTSSGKDPGEALKRRLPLQGQTFYLVANDPDVGLVSGRPEGALSYAEHLADLTTEDIAAHIPAIGLRELMARYAVPEVYWRYSDLNVTFTSAPFSILLLWFGYVGAAIAIVGLGLYFRLLSRWMWDAFNSTDPIFILATAKVWLWTMFGLQQGEYWYLIGIKTLLGMAFIATYVMIARRVREK
jgi:hypothetical protein